ncbi:Transposase (class II) [Lactococcus lactis subsp. lactis]|nr:transposase [Lactococcus lactis]KST91479.1 Transposase (class II) [Lactococcus lactis subsp. lactis]
MNLFGENEVFTKISALGNPLEKLERAVDWEMFRPELNQVFNKERGQGGRKPYDYVMMFKILILQRANNLSDEGCELMILDRLSFRRFLGIDDFTAQIPAAKTIWHFRNELAQAGAGDVLFEKFEVLLRRQGSSSEKEHWWMPRL